MTSDPSASKTPSKTPSKTQSGTQTGNAVTENQSGTKTDSDTKTESDTKTGSDSSKTASPTNTAAPKSEASANTADSANTKSSAKSSAKSTAAPKANASTKSSTNAKAQAASNAKARAAAAAKAAAAHDSLSGRDFAGQVTVTINKKTYILIGNEQQLRAIGTGKQVTRPVWSITQRYERTGTTVLGLPKYDWVDVADSRQAVYAGDADLDTTGKLDEGGSAKTDEIGTAIEGHTRLRYVTVDDNGNEVTARDGLFGANNHSIVSGVTYSADANYLIFRDIDLSHNAENPSNTNWTPLMFSGTMVGAIAPNGDTQGDLVKQIAADGLGTVNADVTKPVISNVTVHQTGELDTQHQQGIGFFASLAPGSVVTSNSLGTSGKVTVANVKLSDVSVTNDSSTTKETKSLLDTLTTGLGAILDFILNTLHINLNLESLLTLHAANPSNFATGAFAGRIYSDTQVINCEVENVYVANAKKGMTGGFVGYTEGSTQYDLVSTGLGQVVSLLAGILNAIPFLGVGDLVNWLLSGVLGLDKLIPVGYSNPVISGAKVTNFQSGVTLGNAESDFAGGFVGMQAGAIIENSSVSSENPFAVKAKLYAGGFAGVSRDGSIGGLLKSLDIDLLSALRPQSLIQGSAMDAKGGVQVQATSYAGGFSGAMANSYAVNDDVTGTVSVKAAKTDPNDNNHKSYAGGFTGKAAVGWALDLGSADDSSKTVVKSVVNLLANLLSGNSLNTNNSGDLLSLAGVSPSAVLGTRMNGTIDVTADGDYVGGLIGAGSGTVIGDSSQTHLEKFALWKYKNARPFPTSRSTVITGVRSVTGSGAADGTYTGSAYVGGIAGDLEPTAVAALLNNTVALVDLSGFEEEIQKKFDTLPDLLGDSNQFAAFELSNVTVEGKDLTVTAKGNYAGGAIGFAAGGDVTNVHLSKLAKVEARGEAGGFIGFTGPSKVAGAGGVSLLGLIKISGLLTVAQYSSVTVRRASVAGIDDGFTVEATGRNTANQTNDYNAGGFYGQANSTKTIDAHVTKLKSVTADANVADANAGGFVGYSTTGGLADAINDSDDTSLLPGLTANDGKLLSVDGLLGAVPYLIPNYKAVDVTYVNGGYVTGDVAGGFAGNLESGKINEFTADDLKDDPTLADLQTKVKASPWAVINIDHVTGGAYAGGFGGKVVSGALATAGKGGISLLGKLGTIDLTSLLKLVSGYVPFVLYSGVKSDDDTFKAAGGTVTATADYGFTVSAKRIAGDATTDLNAGSAGGFIGYGSGVQVSTSSVTKLRHTTVQAPTNLETTGSIDDTYLGSGSAYAVDAPRYAGGYIGKMDIGSTAAVGEGLDLLGGAVDVSQLLSVFNVVVSTIEQSDVTGGTGGYSVRASKADHKTAAGASDPLGMAGGFAGDIEGGHIENSDAHEFAYIIGQVAAGGYVGSMQPGAAANVLGKGNVLSKILDVDNAVSAIQDFVPTIRNSSTDAVICGAAVRAQAASDTTTRRGMAGGYVGHNRGGHVWGMHDDTTGTTKWSSIAGTTPTMKTAYAARIRSVFGHELAGGFTGFMEAADTADVGSIYVLGGLIKVTGLVKALDNVYPTETHTQVTGPLRNMSYGQWQAWRDNVGKYGAYGQQFTNVVKAGADTVTDQTTLNAFLKDYIFGFNVVAGRGQFGGDTDVRQACIKAADDKTGDDKKNALAKCYEIGANLRDSGVAGGHVGLMRTGTITDGQSQDVRQVTAMRAAGGYVGSMEAGAAAEFGGVQLLDWLDLDLGKLLGAPQVFVPVIKSSSVAGYRKGLKIRATGVETQYGVGNAGGYVGFMIGGQIWGDRDSDGNAVTDPAKAAHANVSNLRKVSGTNNIGGYVGAAVSGSTADVDTNASDGFLQTVLDSLIDNANPAGLVSLLKATVVTIRGAQVTADDANWGYTVEGAYTQTTGTGATATKTTKYAVTAGGFAGSLQAAILGDRNSATDTNDAVDASAKDAAANTVTGLRGVEGGQYAGGFFGLADVSSVASVGGGTAGTGDDTNLLLSLLKVGNIGVLEAFRTFIYGGHVTGVADGIQIKAHDSNTSGMLDTTRFTGSAGGFGGGLINGSVKESSVTKLNSVTGLNYVGGFIGHLGKSGTVSANKVSVLPGVADNAGNLVGLTAGLLDIWGSHIENSSVSGIAGGYTVTATHNGEEYGRNQLLTDADHRKGAEIAGGFAGFADLARISGSKATGLKKVTSGELAGGFVGQTTKAYLLDTGVNSALVDVLLKYIVNPLLDLLYVNDAQHLTDAVKQYKEQHLKWLTKYIDLDLFADGDVIHLNLLGLKISVALDKHGTEKDDTDDTALITIGDSKIEVGCSKQGVDSDAAKNVKVQLIKANRTKIGSSLVQGIADGYDVFGGGATQDSDGTAGLKTGYAGGFAAVNDEGLLENNNMTYADTIRGTAGLVGPFTGKTNLESVYDFNTVYGIEGNGNTYRIYRDVPWNWSYALTAARKQFTNGSHMDDGSGKTGSTDTSGELKLRLNRYDVAHLQRSLVPGTTDQYTTPDIQQFADYKDAVMANNESGTDEGENGTKRAEPLGVYVSAAKAVLMLDTAVADNNGGLTPEPDDGQDPCGADGCQTVDLTLQKVWKDLGSQVERPKSITLQITATYTDKDGKTVTPKRIECRDADCVPTEQGNPWNVTMDSSDSSSIWGSTWRKKITGLPVAFVDKGSGANGEDVTRYYTYTVKELAMTYAGDGGTQDADKTPAEAGYSVAVSYDAKERVATVTNSVPSLPDTGGIGTVWLLLLGLLLVTLGGAWYMRDRFEPAGFTVAAAGAGPGAGSGGGPGSGAGPGAGSGAGPGAGPKPRKRGAHVA
ncbi:LPXTG cell wall anchor domain-containing protein [Bifidobacterium simiarum]|uniref:LPXTG cell wall anchor domain-containing protein n=1 Tax=Bifidobacterium simiarum TaxID=2045441 RepID=UPI001BDD3E03|nr:LPXTG cell wall anchor domain-containing protein [Bifidobacterium simiarum]MBT1165550.1 LPXTG cell wall anchor domain-containing protein [Bifidobacterium simiarum]